MDIERFSNFKKGLQQSLRFCQGWTCTAQLNAVCRSLKITQTCNAYVPFRRTSPRCRGLLFSYPPASSRSGGQFAWSKQSTSSMWHLHAKSHMQHRHILPLPFCSLRAELDIVHADFDAVGAVRDHCGDFNTLQQEFLQGPAHLLFHKACAASLGFWITYGCS